MFERKQSALSALLITAIVFIFGIFYLHDYKNHILKVKESAAQKANKRILSDFNTAINTAKNHLRTLADIAIEKENIGLDVVLRSLYRTLFQEKNAIKIDLIRVSYDGKITPLAEASTIFKNDKRFFNHKTDLLFKKMSQLSALITKKHFYNMSSLFFIINISRKVNLPIIALSIAKQTDQGDFIFATGYYWSDYFLREKGLNKEVSFINKKNQTILSSSFEKMTKKINTLSSKSFEDGFKILYTKKPIDKKMPIRKFLILLAIIFVLYAIYDLFNSVLVSNLKNKIMTEKKHSFKKMKKMEEIINYHYLSFSKINKNYLKREHFETDKNEWFFDDFISENERIIAIANIDTLEKNFNSIKTILDLELYAQVKKGIKNVGSFLESVNSYLCEIKDQHIYVSCFILKIDYLENNITYAGAAHPFPIMLAESSHHLIAKGYQLGFEKNSVYQTMKKDLIEKQKIFIYSKSFKKESNILFKKSIIRYLKPVAHYSSHQLASVLLEKMTQKNKNKFFMIIDIKKQALKALRKVA